MTDREFAELVKKYNGEMYAACKKYCKDRTVSYTELMQDIIIELWKSINNFKNGCTFNTWVYTIARNVSISALRKAQAEKKKKALIDGLEDYEEYLQYEDGSEALLKQLQEAMRYNSVLDNIDEPYKTIFIMHLEGMSYKEMEQQTGITENALRVKISTIKKKLRLRYGSK